MISRPIRAILIGTISIATIFSSYSAHAEFRIATVDMGRILNESNAAQSKRKQLDEMTKSARKKIEERQAALKAREAKLKEAKVSDTSKEAEKFRSDAREFARFVKDTEDEIKKQFLKSNKELTERAIQIVEAKAAAGGYSLVLERGERNRNAVLYSESAFDITDSVLKEYDAKS